ncbi:hypothetical protein NBRC111893_1294 [Lentilactobacillus kosonis]|uniref:Uncharacterized protein n=1 Tax=Lentilactobacillus kosonis TaxID=2810561 RepID=A0A401FLK9_9LACO|nr:hypothetical protein NBRC111893_1294 [Lentilactobacillus kosonis]
MHKKNGYVKQKVTAKKAPLNKRKKRYCEPRKEIIHQA